MSAIERFQNAWATRFPADTVPDLQCLRSDPTSSGASTADGSPIYGTVYGDLDRSAVERSLQVCNANIERLYQEIEHQKFVAAYLWNILHGIDSAGLSPDSVSNSPSAAPPLLKHLTKNPAIQRFAQHRTASLPIEQLPSPTEEINTDDALDNQIPLQDFHSPTEMISPAASEGVPDSATVTQGNGIIAVESELSHPKKHFSDMQHPLAVRKRSLPLLDQNIDLEKNYVEEERADSLDSRLSSYTGLNDSSTGSTSPCLSRSGPKTAHRQKPVPTPRMSVQKPGGSFAVRIDGVDNSSSSTDPTTSLDASGIEQLDTEPKRVGVHANKMLVPKPPPKVQFDSPEEGRRMGSVKDRAKAFGGPSTTVTSTDVSVIKESSFNSKRQPRAPRDDRVVYEEAAPFQRERAESDDCSAVSSDDEEPLYYNMMLLKEQMLNRAQTWYAKAGKPGTKKQTSDDSAPTHLNPSSTKHKVLDGAMSRSCESIKSTDSDSAFDERCGADGQSIAATWRKRTSLYCATDSPGSQSESDDLDTSSIPSCPDSGMLQMRKWVVTSVLESERAYLSILDILMQYMQTFRNLHGTAQTVLANCDIEVIFFGIADLHMAHKLFVHELEPVVANWSADQQIATIFQTLSSKENRIAADYLKNYQKAVVTIHRCWQENETFCRLTKEIQVKGMKEKPSLEELLHKPVVRFQRNTLVLHDLVKSTPTSHADYDLLQKTLSSAQHFIENFDGTSYKDSPEAQRYLAKHGLIVEKVGKIRKLRYIFLFNDLLVCARQKISTKQRISFEPKWHIPLIDLTLDDKVDVDEEKQLVESQQQEIEQLQRKVSELQGELKTELKYSKSTDNESHRQWSFHNRSKNMEKIRKNLMEQQAAMIKASPRLFFRVYNRRSNRQFTLLMASDYERSNWRVCIAGLLSRAQTLPTITTAELTNLLNTQKLPKGGALSALVGADDFGLEEELLFGCLNIKIFRLQGLKSPAEAYCTVEVDSFSHFFIKAKTRQSKNSMEPVWNEDFDIDLEGSQTVRILCYRVSRDVGTVIGTCALELSKAWLRGDFLEKAITLSDETSLTISLRYSSREQSMKRSLSNAKGGVFGVRLKAVSKREGTNVPYLIAACVEEVEHRGMQEVGVYRISGVTGEIQKLKRAFEKNSRAAVQLLKEADVHVVTGLLKLYFRELPEALFTDALYPNLVTGMGLADPEAKEKFLASQLQSMPEPNHSTVIFLIDHLMKVAQNEVENKMSLQNLATVFGPTLLRPAAKVAETQTMEELFSSGTRDAMTQTTMLMTFFNLRKKGMVV